MVVRSYALDTWIREIKNSIIILLIYYGFERYSVYRDQNYTSTLL